MSRKAKSAGSCPECGIPLFGPPLKERPPGSCTGCGIPFAEPDTFDFFVPDTSRKFLAVGMSRMGKSDWGKDFSEYLLGEGEAVVTWDVEREYSVHGIPREGCRLGPLAEQVTTSEFLRRVRSPLESENEWFLKHPISVAVVPDNPDATGKELAKELASWLPYVRERGKVHLKLEEVGAYGEWAEDLLQEVVTRWGKDGVVPYLYAQQMTMVPPSPRSGCTDLISFRQYKRSDLEHAAREYGPAFASQLPLLRRKQLKRADPVRAALERMARMNPLGIPPGRGEEERNGG